MIFSLSLPPPRSSLSLKSIIKKFIRGNADWDQLSLCSWSPLLLQQRVPLAHLSWILSLESSDTLLSGSQKPPIMGFWQNHMEISALLTHASGSLLLPQGLPVGISYGVLSENIFPAGFGGRPGICPRPFNLPESSHIWLHETEKSKLQHGLKNYGAGKSLVQPGHFSALEFHSLGCSEMDRGSGVRRLDLKSWLKSQTLGPWALDLSEPVFLAVNERLMTISSSYCCSESQITQFIVQKCFMTNP